jgi:hypothetical protein
MVVGTVVTVGDLESIHLIFKGLSMPSKRQFKKIKPGIYFDVSKGLYKGLKQRLPKAILLTPRIMGSESRFFISNISANLNPD